MKASKQAAVSVEIGEGSTVGRLRFMGFVTRAGWRWLVEVTSNVGAVLMVLAALGVSAVAGVTLPHWWLALVVLGGLYGLLFAEGSYTVWREAMERVRTAEESIAAAAAAPRPHLVFVDPEVQGAGVIATALHPAGGLSTSTVSSGPYEFARINVVNDPPAGSPGATAERVTATITFRADDGRHPVQGMVGRWAETPQRGETGRWGISLEEAQLDVDPNGLWHPIDIAMKKPGDSSCFAFNYENSTVADLKIPKHELNESSYLVQVTLRGSNIEPIGADYVLTNNPGVPIRLRGPYPPQDYGDREIPVASGVGEV